MKLFILLYIENSIQLVYQENNYYAMLISLKASIHIIFQLSSIDILSCQQTFSHTHIQQTLSVSLSLLHSTLCWSKQSNGFRHVDINFYEIYYKAHVLHVNQTSNCDYHDTRVSNANTVPPADSKNRKQFAARSQQSSLCECSEIVIVFIFFSVFTHAGQVCSALHFRNRCVRSLEHNPLRHVMG